MKFNVKMSFSDVIEGKVEAWESLMPVILGLHEAVAKNLGTDCQQKWVFF
jgi:hypothetical protein